MRSPRGPRSTTTAASSTSSASRFQPRYNVISGNELLLGVDWEQSWLRSDRYRAGGTAVTQLSPQDNNQTDNVLGILCRGLAAASSTTELIVRGGVRQTMRHARACSTDALCRRR